jgi:hypothetical protein
MGPYNLSQLRQLASRKQISPGSLAWIDGMASWESIEKITALEGLFDDEDASTATPPPLPKK